MGMTINGNSTPAIVSDDHVKTGSFIGLTSEGHNFKHMTQKCKDALIELEKEEEKDGGQSHEKGHTRGCGTGQMTVLLTRTLGKDTHKASKCFPVEECKCSNIRAELIHNAEKVNKNLTVDVHCIHMSSDCRAALEELEAAMDKSGKKNEKTGHDKKCEDDQMVVKITKSVHGIDFESSKCFPKKKCKCSNIKKDLSEHAGQLHDSAKAKVKVECEEEMKDSEESKKDDDKEANNN